MIRPVAWLHAFEHRLVLRRLAQGHEPDGLRVLLFHQLYASRAEADAATGLPFEAFTVDQLAEVICSLQQAGYSFVGPEAPLAGRQVLLTFDDGYASVLRALPVCEHYQVPLMLSITTHAVASGNAFWWDVSYRQLRRAGRSHAQAMGEVNRRKTHPPRTHTPPQTPLDRPLTVAELQSLAAHRLVSLANHTHTHPLLTGLSDSALIDELNACTDRLERWCGQQPRVIVYPNGDVDRRVESAALARGFVRGFTTAAHLNTKATPPLRLGRFTLNGRLPLAPQLAQVRTGWRPLWRREWRRSP